MKKILLTALALVYYFGVLAIARADISMTGYQEFFAGSGDQSTQGAVDTSTGTSAGGTWAGLPENISVLRCWPIL